VAEVRSAAAAEKANLDALKRPLSADEKREVASRAGRGRRVAI
jgi:hypothetical protein